MEGRLVDATPWPPYPREEDAVATVWEAGWATRPVWTDAKNLFLTGIRSPARPARSGIPTEL